MLPDFERADRIGEFWGPTRRIAPSRRLLIDYQEDRVLLAVLVGMLREQTASCQLSGYAKATIGGQLLEATSPKPAGGSYISS
jgi:hypothetical protein